MCPVCIPLDLFVLYEFVKDMIAQDFSHQLAFLSFQNSRIEVPGEVFDPMRLSFGRVHLENIFFLATDFYGWISYDFPINLL